jgi:hypothetical protein
MPYYRNGELMTADKLRAEYIDRNLAEAKKENALAHRFRKACKKAKDAEDVSDYFLFMCGFRAGEKWERSRIPSKTTEEQWKLFHQRGLKAVSAESYAEGFKVGLAVGARNALQEEQRRVGDAIKTAMESILGPVQAPAPQGPAKAGRRPRKARPSAARPVFTRRSSHLQVAARRPAAGRGSRMLRKGPKGRVGKS